MTSILPTPAEVRAAAARIASHVVRTPLIPSPGLSAIAGGEVLLKLECDQHGGSFKLRGALNALLSLTPAERARGVVASSAGNHGIGVAMAAELLQVPATIFVPATAPAVKREKIAARGARVDASCASYDAAESAARAHAAATGATFVSPCTGRALLAGAGTVGAEILDDLPSEALCREIARRPLRGVLLISVCRMAGMRGWRVLAVPCVARVAKHGRLGIASRL